jgi:hypothetical protein
MLKTIAIESLDAWFDEVGERFPSIMIDKQQNGNYVARHYRSPTSSVLVGRFDTHSESGWCYEKLPDVTV